MNKHVSIVLGGTVPHITLINKLKERGYYTILVDFLDNPPAKEYADEHIQESTLHKEKIVEIAKARGAEIVISTCVDQANSICCYVGEQLNLPHPYNYEVSLDVTDKCRMKEIMWNNGIPTSRFCHIKTADEILEQNLSFPLMVKPADSNSANGVKKVANVSELKEFLPMALKYSRNGFAIVEEFVEGVEISAYCVIVDGKAHLIMAQERLSVIEGENHVIKCYASYAPARISPKAMSKCETIATDIAKAFKLNNTPLFFQGIVNGDDISVIEFAPRVGGGISSQTIKQGTGFDMIDAAIDSFLGRHISLENWHPMKQIYAVNQIYGRKGIYSHSLGIEKLIDEGIINFASFYKKNGARINENSASSGRIGVMVFSGETEDDLLNKIRHTFSSIDCMDSEGESMIRRDLNIFSQWNKTTMPEETSSK